MIEVVVMTIVVVLFTAGVVGTMLLKNKRFDKNMRKIIAEFKAMDYGEEE